MTNQQTTPQTTTPPVEPKLLTAEYYLNWTLTHPTPPGQGPLDEYVRTFNIGAEDLRKLQEDIARFATAKKATEAQTIKKEEEKKTKEEAAAKAAEAEKTKQQEQLKAALQAIIEATVAETLKKQKEEKPKEEAIKKPAAAEVPAAAAAVIQPTVKPELIIARTPYPKWWKDLQTADISLSGPGIQTVIPGRANLLTYIATIVLTVSDETDIQFGFGIFGNSGLMNFGGESEPRGIVIAMGNSPAACGNKAFTVYSNGEDAAVGGFVSYYQESVKETS